MSVISPKKYKLKTDEIATIRSALPEDAPSLLEIQLSLILEGDYTITREEEFLWMELTEEENIKIHAKKIGQIYLVAEVYGDVVGFIDIENGNLKRTAHSGTVSISVRKEWREQGIGSALFHSAIAWAKNDPILEKLTLTVFSTNLRAIALYKKFGFLVEGRCPKYVKLESGEYIDAVLMYKFVK